jgi:hypothetical protein
MFVYPLASIWVRAEVAVWGALPGIPAGGTAGVVEDPVVGGICATAIDEMVTSTAATGRTSFTGDTPFRECPRLMREGP